MNLATIFAIAVASAAPGPIDAFTLNYRETRVSANFTYTSTMKGSLPSTRNDHMVRADWQPSGDAWFTVKGLWESDGLSEHVLIDSDGATMPKGSRASRFPYDILFDSQHYAYYIPSQKKDSVVVRAGGLPFLSVHGAYSWWEMPFQGLMAEEYRGEQGESSVVEIAGRKMHRLVYTSESEHLATRMVLNLDPTIGYLPRYIRAFARDKDSKQKRAIFREMYLINALPCDSGGFLPAEWADTMFAINDFDPHAASYSDDSTLVPSTDAQIGYFKISDFKNRKGAVALERLNGVKHLASPAGMMNLPANTDSLTLPQIMTLLKRNRITPEDQKAGKPAKAVRGRDRAELSVAGLVGMLMLGLGFAACSVYFHRRSRSGLFCIAFFWGMLSIGCQPKPVVSTPQLSIELPTTGLLFNHGEPITLNMRVINEWENPITIIGADGGCSCRNIEKSSFPFMLQPKQSRMVRLQYTPRAVASNDMFQVRFDTPIGVVPSRCVLNIAQRHSMNPASISAPTLYDKQTEEMVEVEYRQMALKSEAFEPVGLVAPESREISITTLGSKETTPENGDIFKEKVVRYAIKIKDQRFGEFKEIAFIADKSGRRQLELPIVWRRRTFIGSVPERVILGERPTRVFLRCPDESVELLRILASPAEVNAVIVSPRELVVRRTGQTPEILDDTIEVATSWNGTSLRIPIVRFAPK